MTSSTSSLTNSLFCPQLLTSARPLLHSQKHILTKPKSLFSIKRDNTTTFTFKAQTLDFPGSFFEGGFGSYDDPPSQTGFGITALEDKEEPKYPSLLVACGGMYVEVFNRGVTPLAYSIKKKNKAGETNTYLNGIYLHFTYFTKPESMEVLEAVLNMDDDVIRSSNFKIRKRKYN